MVRRSRAARRWRAALISTAESIPVGAGELQGDEEREEAMNEPRDVLIVGLFALSVGICLGAICQDIYEEGQAVKHGAARYNPKTGGFEWLDEIDKK